MKARLFWKTLFGFWATYFVISQFVWLPFALFHYNPYDDDLALRVGPAVLELCQHSIELGGPAVCEKSVARLPSDDRRRVQIQPVRAAGASCAQKPALNMPAVGPDGRRYLVCYHYAPAPPWPRYILHTPPEVYVLGAIGGLAFAAVLAWYLIVPLQRIRRGFAHLAEGRLETRVGQATSRRRDEVADLARDFDWMASHLQELVVARERLMHDVSHEFRSPLSRLQVAIGLARQDGGRLPASSISIWQDWSKASRRTPSLKRAPGLS
jgi:two-component system OmpR family sensor kinase